MNSILRTLLLFGSIICLVGCDELAKRSPSQAPARSQVPVQAESKPRPSGSFWEAVQNEDWSLMRRWIEYDSSLVNSRGRYTGRSAVSGSKEFTSDGYTPLRVAMTKANVEMVTFLCQNGADLTVTNVDGDAPLHIAVSTLCHAAKFDPNKQQVYIDIIKTLIDNGANVNARGFRGTPLDWINKYLDDDSPWSKVPDKSALQHAARILSDAGARTSR